MKYGYTSIKQFIILLIIFIMLHVVNSGFAVSQWYISELKGGWQIWISATDYTKMEGLTTTETEAKLAANAEQPWLSDQILIAKVVPGFTEYEFDSSVAGKAYIWGRVADFRGGGQSWFIVLNSDNIGDGPNSLILDTHGPSWQWIGGRDIPQSESPTDLKIGKNTVRIQPRKAGIEGEALFDIFMVSTIPFQPTDDDFSHVKRQTFAVEYKNKLSTVWASIKNQF